MKQLEELKSNTNFNCYCQNNDLCIRQPQYKGVDRNKLQIASNGIAKWKCLKTQKLVVIIRISAVCIEHMNHYKVTGSSVCVYVLVA